MGPAGGGGGASGGRRPPGAGIRVEKEHQRRKGDKRFLSPPPSFVLPPCVRCDAAVLSDSPLPAQDGSKHPLALPAGGGEEREWEREV